MIEGGLDIAFRHRGQPWKALRCGPRCGYCLGPELPLNGAEGCRSPDKELIDARRVFPGTCGALDAVVTEGPQASIEHTETNTITYHAAMRDFLDQVVKQ